MSFTIILLTQHNYFKKRIPCHCSLKYRVCKCRKLCLQREMTTFSVIVKETSCFLCATISLSSLRASCTWHVTFRFVLHGLHLSCSGRISFVLKWNTLIIAILFMSNLGHCFQKSHGLKWFKILEPCKFRNSLFLNRWMMFHCVNIPYFNYPSISL